MLEIEVVGFDRWRQTADLGPTIAALYEHLQHVGDDEIERYGRRLQSLTPGQREVVADLTRSLIKKLLHTPIVSLKSAAERGEAGPRAALYREIFGLDRGRTPPATPESEKADDAGSGPTHVIQGGKED